jgi:DNA polymerase-3 subunit alpha
LKSFHPKPFTEFLFGISIDKLIEKAVQLKMPAVAVTDHGNLFGAVQFFRACKAAGIKPILGMEAYVAPGSRLEKKKQAADSQCRTS